MTTLLEQPVQVGEALRGLLHFLSQPVRLVSGYDRGNLRPDIVAGITVAVILLPQAIAFALVAELPPEMGLYAAITGAIAGALWGSSHQVHTGPANAISLLVLSTLVAIAEPGTAKFIVAAGLLAVMVGIFQLALGLARLGALVNFVSHSVIVGFASGAGLLIAIKQLLPFLGLSFPNRGIMQTLVGLGQNLPQTHLPTLAVGVLAVLVIIAVRMLNDKLPDALLAMVAASLAVFIFGLDENGVGVIGQLPRGLPPMADLPLLDLEFIGRLSTGALAIGAIGLVQTVAVSRTIAAQTGQRLNNNQELVGQGMANVFMGLFSGFPGSGSLSRSVLNADMGARTPIAAILSSIFVILALFTLAPLAAFLPRAALAGVLIVTAVGMIDREEIVRIWQGAPSDAAIMIVTFLGTLFLPIEFAVLLGIILSFGIYIMRTSAPRVIEMVPDDEYKHFARQPGKPVCPQVGVVEVEGDLYFGAVSHVEEQLLRQLELHPERRFLLIRMHPVNHCDFSGIHMLEHVVHAYREAGGDVYMVRASDPVMEVMEATGFTRFLGKDHFLDEDEAISFIFANVLDPAICIYECPLRVFKECQNLPKHIELVNIPRYEDVPEEAVFHIEPKELWKKISGKSGQTAPVVVDVREPREFKQAHIPEARLTPLSSILADNVRFPNDRQIVLVCRSGRRSQRAAYVLQRMGCMNVRVLAGGMQAWEAAHLLEAVDEDG